MRYDRADCEREESGGDWMSKYRVYELAKDYGTSSKVIIDILARNNIIAKNHMSSVGDDAKAVIERTFARKTDTAPAKPTAAADVAGHNSARQTGAGNGHRRSGPPRGKAASPGQRTETKAKSRDVSRQPETRHEQPAGGGVSKSRQPGLGGAAHGGNRSAHRGAVHNNSHGKPASAAGHEHKPNHRDGGRPGRHPNQHAARSRHMPEKTPPPRPKSIKLSGPVSVKELAGSLGREVAEVIKKLMQLGTMATINQQVDLETATIVAEEFGVTVQTPPPEEDLTEIPEIEDDPATLKPRPPVVTVMGHVDHGKTSLLDAIRQTNVTAHEAGGITQHIGAYQVSYHGKRIVFLDTPGHEAFTAMRARGAQVTDIAVLVVAADDGVMPQTIEAINHAKAAHVPIVVAINKIDLPGANPDRVKQQLTEHGLIAEDWGGDTIMVPVSAHQKTGLSDLLEMILLVAEMQEIKANPNRPAYGVIIEAKLDKGRGPVATVLIQKGTLRIGDAIVAGVTFGRVRAMINDRGEKVKKAEPSTPVEVLGLSDVPLAGDVLAVVSDEKLARTIAEKRQVKKRTEGQQAPKVSLEELFKHIQEGELKDLNIVVKADVQGSIEALQQSLSRLANKEVRVNIVHAGVGAVNESDVMLAAAANALIIAFNVRPDVNARNLAEKEKIDIRTYRVIYDVIDDVEAAITGMLAPQYKEVVQGRAEVRKIFNVSKAVVAGCYVQDGKIISSAKIRIIRNGVVVHEGEIDSLRRFKDDVKEVAAGYECGISLEKFRDIKEGDIIEAFTMEPVQPGT